MDKKVQILLGSHKNIASVNVDTYDKVELTNNVSELMEYDVNDAVNSTEVFDKERESNPIYRIYGRIEYLSMLNGLKNNYSVLSDFFNPQYTGNSKNILNSFQFYLVRPATGYTFVAGGSYTSNVTNIIDEKFDNWVTSSPSNYPFGWTVSVTTNSYVQQAPTNRAQFVLDNQFLFTTPFNFISLRKDLSTPVYGDFVIETNVSISPLIIGTDLLTISVFSNATLLYSFPTLAVSAGYKQYVFNVPSSTPITHVSIFANSSNKSIYMDYFKLYQTGATVTFTTTDKYIRYFEVIATPDDFELYPIGFSNNVYGEQTYAFNFKKDFDVSQYFDNFNFPATELFLYAQYILRQNYNGIWETMKYTKQWTTGGIDDRDVFPTTTLNIGDFVKTATGAKIGDLIDYQKTEFLQTQVSGQSVYITTQYKNPLNQSLNLVWYFNPFIPFRLRYLANELSAANINSTSYDLVESIPEYATKIDGYGNYVWREIVPQGYTEPLTGLGVDYPFFNKRRYLFSTTMLSIMPDLTDGHTQSVFNNIWFSRNVTNINKKPNDDLNNIGKPCR